MQRFFTWAAVLLCTALLAWVQFSFSDLHDGDSYFHTRAAHELARNGIQKSFPQAAFSTWSEAYSDKDFLFHVLLIPFQWWNGAEPAVEAESSVLIHSGKQAVVFFTLLFFGATAWALRLVKARLGWLWILLLFSAHPGFLAHLLTVRPHLLGYALIVVEAAAIVRRRWLLLGVLGAVHTLAHSSFVLVPVMAVTVATAGLVRREALPLKTLAAAIAGPLAATLLHPYFPNNVELAWDQLFNVARSVWGLGREIPSDLFGPELTAASTADLLAHFPAWLPWVTGLLACVTMRPAKTISTEGLALTWVAGVMAIFAFLSQRFFGFLLPVTILAGARLWTELIGEESLGVIRRERAPAFWGVAALLVGSLLVGQVRGHVGKVRTFVNSYLSPSDVRPAVDFLRAAAAADELVYHNFWWDFSTLYHFRPEGRYVEGLDPVFFHEYDGELFQKALRAFRGRSRNLYSVLVEDFDAHWIFVVGDPKFRPFRRLLGEDGRFEKVFSDGHSEVWSIQRAP